MRRSGGGAARGGGHGRITAGSPLWDPEPALREEIAAGRTPAERSQWGRWYERLQPGVRVRNRGVFRERTDEIEPRSSRSCRGATASPPR